MSKGYEQNTHVSGNQRTHNMQLTYAATNKQWLHNLALIAQVKLWNNFLLHGLDCNVTKDTVKRYSKTKLLILYTNTLTGQGIHITVNN